MTARSRREEEKSALRKTILDAARTLFVSRSIEDVTLRMIADSIDYTAPTILNQEQLETLAKQVEVPIFIKRGETDVQKIANEALAYGRAQGSNVIIFDTAGRLQIDEPLVQELVRLRDDRAGEQRPRAQVRGGACERRAPLLGAAQQLDRLARCRHAGRRDPRSPQVTRPESLRLGDCPFLTAAPR